MLLAVLVVTDNEFQTVGAALGQTDEDSSSLSGRGHNNGASTPEV